MKCRPHGVHASWSLCLFLTAALASPARSATVPYYWSHAFGGSSIDEPFAAAIDETGNVIVTGCFQGTVDFGGGPLTSAGGNDIYLVKYDAHGNHLWSERFGGTGDDQGRALAIGAHGDIYVTGLYSSTVDFGTGALTSAGATDVFIARYHGDGSPSTSVGYGGTGTDIATGIAVDASGQIVITGFFSGSSWYGYQLPYFTSAGGYDVFLVRYQSNSLPRWGESFGGTSSDVGNAVALDDSGNVYLAGYFQDTASFGGAALTSAGYEDIFLAKYDVDGVHRWSKGFGGTLDDNGTALAVDASGNVFLTGTFESTVDFGGGALTSAGDADVFLAKYDAGGVYQWSHGFGDTGYDAGAGVVLDASGNPEVTGTFTGTVSFGGGAPLVSAGNEDVFLAKYDGDGAHLWSQGFGGPSSDYGISIAVGASGTMAATGAFAGSASFGGPTFTSAGGSQDVFVAQYGANAAGPTIASIGDVGNDQGRQVQIAFRSSGFDTPDSPVRIASYEAYRRDDPTPAATSAAAAPPSSQAPLAEGWQFVGSVPAHGDGDYLIDAPTVGDSTISHGQYYSTFFIRAAGTTPLVFYDSAIDSGYSLDNLAPPAPANLTYNTPALSWLPSTAGDFDYFSVYGSSAPTLDASATLIGYTTGTSYDVSGNPGPFYYVTATDFSGNEGPGARVNTASGAGDTPLPRALAVSAYPNPFNPLTTIRYDVPSAGRVVVAVYDAAGARVATLVDTERNGGSYSEQWDGRDARGAPVSSGIYFVRVVWNGSTKTRKIALVK